MLQEQSPLESTDYFLIDENDRPVEPLAELLEVSDIEPSQPVEQLCQAMRDTWIERGAQFRMNIVQQAAPPSVVQAIRTTASDLRITIPWDPTLESVDELNICGAKATAIKKRIGFALQKVSATFEADRWHGLASTRELVDDELALLGEECVLEDCHGHFAFNEADAMEFLLDKYAPGYGSVTCAPMWRPPGEERYQHANMQKTMEARVKERWKQEGESVFTKPRSIAIATSGPFFRSQALQASIALPRDNELDVIGYGMPMSMQTRPHVILDELAKSFALELERRKAIQERGMGARIVAKNMRS